MRVNNDNPIIHNPTFNGMVVSRYQTMQSSGAVSLATLTTVINAGATIAATLANGTDGQIKILVMKVATFNGVVTVATLTGGTTLTFNAVGDTVWLQFLNGAWQVIYNLGVAIA